MLLSESTIFKKLYAKKMNRKKTVDVFLYVSERFNVYVYSAKMKDIGKNERFGTFYGSIHIRRKRYKSLPM